MNVPPTCLAAETNFEKEIHDDSTDVYTLKINIKRPTTLSNAPTNPKPLVTPVGGGTKLLGIHFTNFAESASGPRAKQQ